MNFFLVYQQNKGEKIKTLGFLQPLSILIKCLEEVSMDFITGLPKHEGKKVIMVVVDRLTKYGHFYSISHCFKIRMVDATLMERIKKLHGIPKIIVSDRDPIFIRYFWKEIYYFLGNQLPHNSSTILNLMENIRL